MIAAYHVDCIDVVLDQSTSDDDVFAMGSGNGSGSGYGAEMGSGVQVTSSTFLGNTKADDTTKLLMYSNLSIALPSDAFDKIEDQNETGIVLSFYLVPSLFPVSDAEKFVVGSPVIAASIAGREVSNLSNPVVITLRALTGRVSIYQHEITNKSNTKSTW